MQNSVKKVQTYTLEAAPFAVGFQNRCSETFRKVQRKILVLEPVFNKFAALTRGYYLIPVQHKLTR